MKNLRYKYPAWTLTTLLVMLSLINPFTSTNIIAQDNTSATKSNTVLTERLLLPLVGAASEIDRVVELTTNASAQDEWLTYDGTYFSISYPPDREVEEGFGGQYLVLRPTEDLTNKIEIAYLGYEIDSEDDLLEWYNLYIRLGGLSTPERQVLENHSEVHPDGTVARRLHLLNTDEFGPSQVILVTYGRLVLAVHGPTHDESMAELLRSLVNSISFHTDAPTTKADLYPGEENLITTLDEVMAISQAPPEGTPAPDPLTLGQEITYQIPSSTTLPLSEEFLEEERLYRESLVPEDSIGLDDTGLVVAAGQVTANRQALPADFRAPYHGSASVRCASAFHTVRAAYAIDIGIPVGTAVAAVQAGTIDYAGWYSSGYGWILRIYSDVNAGGGTRRYYHNHAHLDAFARVSGNVIRGEWVANSGNSGTTDGAHLHFHMTRDVNFNDVDQRPVDLTPLGGFRPNLYYPVSGDPVHGLCGNTISADLDPIVIEPIMYTNVYHPRSAHNWNCSTYLTNKHTTECYMAVVPLTGWGISPLVSSQSPELRYANVYSFSTGTYYVWVCGYGGTPDDDSVYIGANDNAASAPDVTGHHPASWLWRSIRLNGQRPTISLGFANQVVNMWAREDGMRVDRILLTKDVNYNPAGNIRCGGY